MHHRCSPRGGLSSESFSRMEARALRGFWGADRGGWFGSESKSTGRTAKDQHAAPGVCPGCVGCDYS
jgi:hypothetical protein